MRVGIAKQGGAESGAALMGKRGRRQGGKDVIPGGQAGGQLGCPRVDRVMPGRCVGRVCPCGKPTDKESDLERDAETSKASQMQVEGRAGTPTSGDGADDHLRIETHEDTDTTKTPPGEAADEEDDGPELLDVDVLITT